MDVKCVVIELKPNSLSRVKEWVSFVKENEAEALQSLENEGVTVENFFLFAICIFWPIPITDSGLNRSPILEYSDH